MTTLKEREKQQAIEDLRKILKPGMVVYTVLRKVSSSGMSRQIDVYVIEDNRPRWLTGLVAKACEYRRADKGHGPLQVGGCGMDMGFAVVYDLSRVVFRDGWKCIGQKRRCPANDHNNDYIAFSHKYDEEHDPNGDARFTAAVTPEQQAARVAYVTAKDESWKATEEERWSRRRRHSDPGYALRHEWL